MKTRLIYIFVLAITLVSCNRATKQSASSTYKGEDLFTEKAYPKYAKGFTVKYHKNFKELTVKNPWDTSSVSYEYILVQRGTPAPTNTGNKIVIEIPVRTVLPVFTPQIGFVNELGEVATIKGVSEIKHVKNLYVRDQYDKGAIKSYGVSSNLDLESIMKLNPEMMIVSPFKNDKYSKLREVGINVICCASYMETTPMGRAEWIKFISYFYNKEKRASEIIDNSKREYDKLVQLTKNISKKPTVASIDEFGGNWYVAGGASYMSNFFRDAGAEYLWDKNTQRGSFVLDYEVILKKAHKVDFIRTGMSIDEKEFSTDHLVAGQPKFKEFSAVDRKHIVYCNTKRTPYYEKGIVEPHIILADFVKLFHPDLKLKHTNKYISLIK